MGTHRHSEKRKLIWEGTEPAYESVLSDFESQSPNHSLNLGVPVREREREMHSPWEDQRRLLEGGGIGSGIGGGRIQVWGWEEHIPGFGDIRTNGRSLGSKRLS